MAERFAGMGLDVGRSILRYGEMKTPSDANPSFNRKWRAEALVSDSFYGISSKNQDFEIFGLDWMEDFIHWSRGGWSIVWPGVLKNRCDANPVFIGKCSQEALLSLAFYGI